MTYEATQLYHWVKVAKTPKRHKLLAYFRILLRRVYNFDIKLKETLKYLKTYRLPSFGLDLFVFVVFFSSKLSRDSVSLNRRMA
jgi:hypothetical protein